MADHPLRPATDRRLGGPLPRQQANPTQAHLNARAFKKRPSLPRWAYEVLAWISPCYPPHLGRFLRVTHPSATLLASEETFAFDLHVLSIPPAFNLSQDQTLQFNLITKGIFCLTAKNNKSWVSQLSRNWTALLCFKPKLLASLRREPSAVIRHNSWFTMFAKPNHLRKRPQKLFGLIFKRAFPEHNPVLTVVQGGSALYASLGSRQHLFKTNLRKLVAPAVPCFSSAPQTPLKGGAFYSNQAAGQHLFEINFQRESRLSSTSLCA